MQRPGAIFYIERAINLLSIELAHLPTSSLFGQDMPQREVQEVNCADTLLKSIEKLVAAKDILIEGGYYVASGSRVSTTVEEEVSDLSDRSSTQIPPSSGMEI